MLHQIVKEDLDFIAGSNLNWPALKNSTVLISGANGFLPHYLAEALLNLNDSRQLNIKVIALVRNPGKAELRFSHRLGRADFQLVTQDVCEPVTYPGNIDYIIHAASQASPLYYSKDPIGTQNANIIGTTNLLKLGQEKKVKSFLFFSSGEVYGTPRQIPTGEDDYGYMDPLLLRSCYGESKRMGENICACWWLQHQVPVKMVRPFHTYGPGLDLADGRVFADFVADVVKGVDIVMKSDGSDVRAFCYIADATIGFLKVMLDGRNGEAYNVGSDKETSIKELAEILTGLFPEKKLRVVMDEKAVSDGYVRSAIRKSCANIAKIKSLGWQPVYGVAEGFKRMILSYQ